MSLFTAYASKYSGLPYLAVAVTDRVSPDSVAPYKESRFPLCIELRVDLCEKQDPESVKNTLRSFAAFPRLLTIRSSSEGGNWQESDAVRHSLYSETLSDAEGIDIELSARSICAPLIRECKALNKTVIGSFHDFSATPSIEKLDALVLEGKSLGVDAVKVAAHCHSSDDLRRLTCFLLSHPQDALIVMGMGRDGTPSRLFFPFLGSLLTYTFVGTPSAPGQKNLDEMLHFLNYLLPEF
ncbi:MAG TPA: type I 3-dehydroquinate dehydratase [Candidatus Hydrogenedentes bacterium]|jgi:3-dehydroquinate dehydratase-1|nr:MAG: Catabolic 3-dehydroquinate dehydratase [Candidatus Hydrogenedentes bacterium ADurb.Bin170]HNZ48679.1 type I 3-dehydroquinate dehydratase [Candidatus Hydrogenedentota bacterium]HOD94711.1 type I 3-dehydroquinate dehydratase [Candidatus Hydrogenedentota bacterium]HOH42519.1 type I 3-dehydroquinate dehydratase [Candidatus Hydrogenedentota bacterium]HOM48302.1 type I 3-dehydroquinate dehydratase [Candidatus Hydrogenedentota bacterium]